MVSNVCVRIVSLPKQCVESGARHYPADRNTGYICHRMQRDTLRPWLPLIIKHRESVIAELEEAATRAASTKAPRRRVIETYLTTVSCDETARRCGMSYEAVRALMARAARCARRLEGIDPFTWITIDADRDAPAAPKASQRRSRSS